MIAHGRYAHCASGLFTNLKILLISHISLHYLLSQDKLAYNTGSRIEDDVCAPVVAVYKTRAWPQGDVGEVAEELASFSFSLAETQ